MWHETNLPCHMIVVWCFFGQLTFVYKRFFPTRGSFLKFWVWMASFFSSRWSGLVSAIWSRNSLQMDSWLVGYHARCVVVPQWYSVQPCTATNLPYQKLFQSEARENRLSSELWDEGFKYIIYLKMLTRSYEKCGFGFDMFRWWCMMIISYMIMMRFLYSLLLDSG